MTSEFNNVDALWIDRLVDGELSQEQRRRLLLACESSPERWRDVALAFVETQVWTSHLSSLRGESIGDGLAPRAKPVSHDLVSVPPASSPIVDPCFERSRLTKTSEAAKASLWRYLTMATAVSIALSLGFGVGAVTNLLTGNAISNRGADASPKIVDNQNQPKRSSPESVYMLVHDQGSESLRPLEIPILESTAQGMKTLAQSSALPDKVRRLQSQGHEVEQIRHLYPFQLHDGRTIVVPIDDIRVNFRSVQ